MLEGHQTLQITVVAMVLAIALELLITRVSSLNWTEVSLAEQIIYSLQTLAIFQALVFIWLSYGQSVTLIRWRMEYMDALFPFAIGAIIFFMIQMIGSSMDAFFCATAGAALGGAGVFRACISQREHDADSILILADLRPRPIYIAFTLPAIWSLASALALENHDGWAAVLAVLGLNVTIVLLAVVFVRNVGRLFGKAGTDKLAGRNC
jgi:hypothetical protein